MPAVPAFSRLRQFAVTAFRATRPIRRRPLGLTPLEDRTTPAFLGGVNVAFGDLNGDSYPDLVVGQTSGGCEVRAVDGKTGGELSSFFAYESTFTGGVYVAAGDVDGDGKAEVITGTGNTGGPRVRVFDGETGEVKSEFFPYEDTFRGGVIVATADVTGDGKAEIVTGTGVGGGPRVQVFDAATLNPLANFFAYEDTFRGGVLVGSGDVNGDGKAEIVTGTGVGGGPRVQVFDAASLSPLANFFAYESTFRGGVLIGAGDTDGDGKAEVLTGTGPTGGAVVTVFGGTDATERGRFLADAPEFRGGIVVAGGDMTGDGKAEIITGLGPGGSPTVKVFSPDGATTLVNLSAFDPIQLPGTPISAPPSTTTDLSLASFIPIGLRASQAVAVVGSNQQLVFTAKAGGSTTPSRVELFKSDAQGTAGESLLDLFDDGAYGHRDAAAQDGVFSNTFTVNYPTAGDNYYLARVTVGGSTVSYTTKVAAVARPSSAVVQQRLDQQSQLQGQLTALTAGGMSDADALAEIEAVLRNSPSGVDVRTVQRTPEAVYWRTVEGMPFGVETTSSSKEVEGTAAPAGESAASAAKLSAATADAADTCPGKAIFLSPYWYDFTPDDPVNRGPAAIQAQGYDDPTIRINPDGDRANVTVDDFKNLGQYDVVVIHTHGTAVTPDVVSPDFAPTSFADIGPTLAVGEKATLAKTVGYIDDIMANRITVIGDHFALTPSFFLQYTGQMHDSAVLIQACHSADTPILAYAFLSVGAGVVTAETRTGYAPVTTPWTLDALTHLANGGTFGTVPHNKEVDSDPLHDRSQFTVFTTNSKGKLSPDCATLLNTDLEVTYTWTNNQHDLDSGTQFLGGAVGYSCPGSPYMTFTGDNTGVNGFETATVNLYKAYQEGLWTTSVPVTLVAGRYEPAGGKGSASVSVAMKDKTTGVLRNQVNRSINPGTQSGQATTVVGTATVTLTGPTGHEAVTFTVS